MKIKINNETNYDTSWLRQLLNRSKRIVDRRMRGKHKIKEQCRVDVVYKNSYSSRVGGYAYINNSYVRLKVIRPPQDIKMNGWSQESIVRIKAGREKVMEGISRNIAETMVHELYHCYGYRHKDSIMYLPRKKVWIESTYNYDWCSKYPVQFKIEKPKPEKIKEDIRMKRYYQILDLLKEKQSKLKRLQNQIKKYFSKKHYYEKILVAVGKIKKD